MPESDNIILEERGFFWWLGEAVPKSDMQLRSVFRAFSLSMKMAGHG